jgi:tetratricopeptide (TPR) repeat protein
MEWKAPRIGHLFLKVGFLYLVLIFSFYRIVDIEAIKWRIADELKVPIDYLILFSDNKVPFNEHLFRKHLVYYEQLDSFIPENAEIEGLLAFCCYYLGDVHRSIEYFQKALAKKPYHFWFLYNLGMIYYQTGDFHKSLEFFEKALDQSTTAAEQFTKNSRFYKNFDNSVKNTDGFPDLLGMNLETLRKEHLSTAYENCFRMMVHCYESLKDYLKVTRTCQIALGQNVSSQAFFYYYLGLGAFESKKYQAAQEALKACLVFAPHHRETLRLLRLCSQALKDPQRVEDYRKKVAETNPATMGEEDFRKVDLKLRIF